jgi:hypothetical protein
MAGSELGRKRRCIAACCLDIRAELSVCLGQFGALLIESVYRIKAALRSAGAVFLQHIADCTSRSLGALVELRRMNLRSRMP